MAVPGRRGKEKAVYLFEPWLGLPIPAPDGVRLDDGQLDVFPPRSSRSRPTRSSLDRLDFDAEHPYWVKSADLKRPMVLVEASPMYLSTKGAR